MGTRTCKKCGKMSPTFIGDITNQLCKNCEIKRKNYLEKRYKKLEE